MAIPWPRFFRTWMQEHTWRATILLVGVLVLLGSLGISLVRVAAHETWWLSYHLEVDFGAGSGARVESKPYPLPEIPESDYPACDVPRDSPVWSLLLLPGSVVTAFGLLLLKRRFSLRWLVGAALATGGVMAVPWALSLDSENWALEVEVWYFGPPPGAKSTEKKNAWRLSLPLVEDAFSSHAELPACLRPGNVMRGFPEKLREESGLPPKDGFLSATLCAEAPVERPGAVISPTRRIHYEIWQILGTRLWLKPGLSERQRLILADFYVDSLRRYIATEYLRRHPEFQPADRNAWVRGAAQDRWLSEWAQWRDGWFASLEKAPLP
jgi:hypothetical protein